jgi:hypothetical protein
LAGCDVWHLSRTSTGHGAGTVIGVTAASCLKYGSSVCKLLWDFVNICGDIGDKKDDKAKRLHVVDVDVRYCRVK